MFAEHGSRSSGEHRISITQAKSRFFDFSRPAKKPLSATFFKKKVADNGLGQGAKKTHEFKNWLTKIDISAMLKIELFRTSMFAEHGSRSSGKWRISITQAKSCFFDLKSFRARPIFEKAVKTKLLIRNNFQKSNFKS